MRGRGVRRLSGWLISRRIPHVVKRIAGIASLGQPTWGLTTQVPRAETHVVLHAKWNYFPKISTSFNVWTNFSRTPQNQI
jgi:hypothetical protein